MDPEAQPTPIKGERNIHCPHYNDCLDYVVNHFWRSWSCSECPYETVQGIYELEYEVNDDDLRYEVSPDIVREIRKDPVR